MSKKRRLRSIRIELPRGLYYDVLSAGAKLHGAPSLSKYLLNAAMTYTTEYLKDKKIELDKIDYIVMNHSEIDHSGALPELMKHIPDTPIYCTENGVKVIKGHYHRNWNFKTVKTGDTLPVGNGKELIFVEMKMLHWPDSMASYLTKDNVLFSNDAFGQHYAGEQLFNDGVDQGAVYSRVALVEANREILCGLCAVVHDLSTDICLRTFTDIVWLGTRLWGDGERCRFDICIRTGQAGQIE